MAPVEWTAGCTKPPTKIILGTVHFFITGRVCECRQFLAKLIQGVGGWGRGGMWSGWVGGYVGWVGGGEGVKGGWVGEGGKGWVGGWGGVGYPPYKGTNSGIPVSFAFFLVLRSINIL